MGKGGPLFDRWMKFSVDSLAGVARAIAESVHDVSPKRTLAYQGEIVWHLTGGKVSRSVNLV